MGFVSQNIYHIPVLQGTFKNSDGPLDGRLNKLFVTQLVSHECHIRYSHTIGIICAISDGRGGVDYSVEAAVHYGIECVRLQV